MNNAKNEIERNEIDVAYNRINRVIDAWETCNVEACARTIIDDYYKKIEKSTVFCEDCFFEFVDAKNLNGRDFFAFMRIKGLPAEFTRIPIFQKRELSSNVDDAERSEKLKARLNLWFSRLIFLELIDYASSLLGDTFK